MNLVDFTIADAAPLLHERKISPVELTRAYLERIERLNPLLNAYITVTAEQALDAARQAEAEIMRGEYRGMLHGIPIALKDNIETAGIRTTVGSSYLRDYVPTEDAEVVKQLKSAGAIILGKTNLHEWAFGVINNNPWYGDTRNPWDTSRITGGSSGGSASAVAAKLCMAALGTDTRGSVRVPAALCGVVGYKPAKSRISLLGVIPLSHTLDHVGVLARTAGDAEMVVQMCVGNRFGERGDVPEANRGKSGQRDSIRRIAMARDVFTSAVSEVVESHMNHLHTRLIELSFEVEYVDLSFLEEAWKASRIISSVEAAEYHAQRLAENADGFGADVRPRLEEGMGYSAVQYVRALRSMDLLERSLQVVVDKYDAILLPTLPMTAPRHDDAVAVADARKLCSAFNAPFNMVRYRAISIPTGTDDQGLPVGIQLVTNEAHVTDLAFIAFARQLQRAAGWDGRLPEL